MDQWHSHQEECKWREGRFGIRPRGRRGTPSTPVSQSTHDYSRAQSKPHSPLSKHRTTRVFLICGTLLFWKVRTIWATFPLSTNLQCFTLSASDTHSSPYTRTRELCLSPSIRSRMSRYTLKISSKHTAAENGVKCNLIYSPSPRMRIDVCFAIDQIKRSSSVVNQELERLSVQNT